MFVHHSVEGETITMKTYRIVSDGISCDSSLTESIATGAIQRLYANEDSNKEMLQKFMGIRPVRRHASMRNKSRSARREIERRMEEEESIISNSSIAVDEEETREAQDDIINTNDDNDNWSSGGVQSLPSTIVVSNQAQQHQIKSRLVVQSSSSSSSSILTTSLPKRRLLSLTSKLKCVTCVAGISHHEENELDEELHYDNSTSEDEIESQQQNEDKFPNLFAVFDSYFNMNSNANEIDSYVTSKSNAPAIDN